MTEPSYTWPEQQNAPAYPINHASRLRLIAKAVGRAALPHRWARELEEAADEIDRLTKHPVSQLIDDMRKIDPSAAQFAERAMGVYRNSYANDLAERVAAGIISSGVYGNE